MPAASNLKLYNSTGSAVVTSITFTGVVPGTRSAAQTFRLYNDASAGAVEQATDPYLVARAADPVTDEPLLRGVRAVDERWIEVELPGVSSSDVSQFATGIEPIGRGRVQRVVSLPSGAWVQVKVYFHPPMSAPEGSTRFTLDAEANGPAVALEQGHSEGDRDGVLAGIGDGTFTELVVGGTITATGTPDTNVNFPDVAWAHKGVPKVKLAHALALNNQDSAAATLGAGEAYWARLSLGAGTTVTVTKSTKFATGAADPANVPAVPAGEIDCGYVLRDDTAAIDSADITSRLWAARFEFTASSLNLTIGSGSARVDNALLVRRARPILALSANQANVYVWLLPDGSFTSTTTTAKPDPRAYLLGYGPTGASSITLASWIDLRDPIGPVPVPLRWDWSGTLTDGLKAYAVWPLARDGYLRVPRGLVYRHHSNGSGNTTGVTKVDLKINGTTVFTSSGTLDRRPSIAYNASPALSTAGLPEVLLVPPFALLEAEIKRTTAYDGTAPSGATLFAWVDPT